MLEEPDECSLFIFSLEDWQQKSQPSWPTLVRCSYICGVHARAKQWGRANMLTGCSMCRCLCNLKQCLPKLVHLGSNCGWGVFQLRTQKDVSKSLANSIPKDFSRFLHVWPESSLLKVYFLFWKSSRWRHEWRLWVGWTVADQVRRLILWCANTSTRDRCDAQGQRAITPTSTQQAKLC